MSITKGLEGLSDRAVAVASAAVERRSSRRGFLARATMVGSAIAVAPLRFLLRPESAWAAITCANCPGQLCCDGNSTFCCTLTGTNSCPSDTTACGWWYCSIDPLYCSQGVRYFVDCCGCGTCRCAFDSCGNRRTCCFAQPYDNCSQTVGTVRCRIVRCGHPADVVGGCNRNEQPHTPTCCDGANCVNHPSGPGCGG